MKPAKASNCAVRRCGSLKASADSCRRMTDLAPPNGISARAFFRVMTRESRQASSVATSKDGYVNQRTPPRPGPRVVSSTEITAESPLTRSWQSKRFSPRTSVVPGASTGPGFAVGCRRIVVSGSVPQLRVSLREVWVSVAE